MKLKPLDLFEELGYPGGARLKDAIQDNPQDNERDIVNYLKNGITIVVSPHLTFDVLDPSKPLIGPARGLTDGVWVWSIEIAYYVEKYHLRLPTEFVNYAQKHKWQIPSEDNLDLDNIEFDLS
jgi:hypothetical protein